jgi:hypothetical protein
MSRTFFFLRRKRGYGSRHPVPCQIGVTLESDNCGIVRWRDCPRRVKIYKWRVESATTASSGSSKGKRTTAGRRPKRFSRWISPKICGAPGTGCARPLLLLAISGFTLPINRSCSRGNPATSSCVQSGAFSNSASSLAAHLRLPRYAASTEHQNPSSFTLSESHIGTRWSHRLRTGLRKHMTCRALSQKPTK